MRLSRPTALTIVACCFLAFGLEGLVRTIADVYRQTGGAKLGALNLLVGLGLLRRDPYWRRWALAACWLAIATTAFLLPYVVLGAPWGSKLSLYGRPLGEIPQAWIITYVLANFALTAWQLRVLLNPSVRALFVARESPRQRLASAQ